MATTAQEDGDPRPRWGLSGADNPLVRAVGRLPATVQAKLLMAYVGPVLLLVVVGVLGLRVIGDSNDRIVTLGVLQQRATAYRDLQAVAAQVRQLLGERTAASPSQENLVVRLPSLDRTIRSTLLALDKAADVARLGFVPPADQQSTLALIRQLRVQLSEVMTRIAELDGPGGDPILDPIAGIHIQRTDAEPLANRLVDLTGALVASTQRATNAMIDLNRRSFAASRDLFILVALGSIILALMLGYVLSRSIIGPIQRMETRLAAIASGDFSGHVEVSNRDELGALASNLNRMNDELGRLYEALETASRHKSEFLATMSHELRTPLNAIIGFSQVLKEQMFGELNAKQADYVDDVLSSGQHLLNLINDILDLAKVEAGRMELQPSTFALPELLENAMSMVRERATRQGITMTIATDPSVGLVEADERKVKQIVFNLLSNAVKFTPGGGQVTLAASAADGQVEISVRDTGVGISAEDQERIFEEFYQVGASRTQEGTGLGLALTRRLVELHHGRLSVESEPGVGSTFTITLPLHQREVAPEIATTTAGEPVSL
jgi:signal transduction histidine kinase